MNNNKGEGKGDLNDRGLINFLPQKRWGGGGREFTVIINNNKSGTHSKLPPLQLSVDSPTIIKWQICSGQF